MSARMKTLLIILGPTASGKTGLAIKIAKQFGTEIISADSRQFYKELTIGTAKPSPEQLAEVKHHFIGHISIAEQYNISRFEQDVLKLLDELFKTHDIVVMCGGSGLYVNAVCHGLDEQPEHDPAIRQMLQELYKTKGIDYLRGELLRLDPEYYRQVDLSNPNRLMRALEVCQMTGKPYSSYRKGQKKQRDFRILKYGIDMSRKDLIDRINHRTDAMVSLGLIEEARANIKYRHLNALNTVGYKEIFEYLEGNLTLEEAVEKIKINTRRYAKRQMTWFRKDPEIIWIKPENFNSLSI
ncbi:MAG: tRNA (adenosine(37)-N6)-dimethylallyltransferase MiaA [Bacteroidales bacterium]|nr:tRNA (adenosine(37)-N6)-dimethylallyltransferase MiaA [Bacteroidales bacterium]